MGGGPRRDRRRRARRLPGRTGEHVTVLLGAANTDDAEFGDADEVVLRPRVRTGTSRSAAESTVASAHTSPAWSCASRCGNGTGGIPDYALKPGHQLTYTAGIRSIEHFPMVLG